MPRKGTVERREVSADPVHGSPLVQKFVNCVMLRGEKSVAQQVVYDAFGLIQQRANDDPLKVFKKAVENVKPTLEVKTRRVGGANYQVPVEVNRNRQTSLSLRICILMVKFWRSTCEVLTLLISGFPKMGTFLQPMHSAGE